MRTERLGLLPAVVIVWVSGFILGLLLDVGLRDVTFNIATGLVRSEHGGPWAVASTFVATRAVVGGLVVFLAVQMMGFRVSYALAASALGLGSFLTIGLEIVLATSTAGDATGLALSGLSVLFLPAWIVLGLLLPAYLVDLGTLREVDHMPPPLPYQGTPSG